MRKFKTYYLALSGSINDRWKVMERYYKLINILSNKDEDLKHELIVHTMFKFDYIAEKINIYFEGIDIKKLKKI